MSRRRLALPGFRSMLWGLLGAATVLGIARAEPLFFDVAKAEFAYDQRTNEPIVKFRLTPDSARTFAEFTAHNVGRATELRVDGKVLARPVIREPSLGGAGQISGDLSEPEASDIAARLSAGTKIEIEAVAN